MSADYPIYLNLGDKKCVVVGGGKVAERKVKNLLDCSARVCVISPDLSKWLRVIAEEGRITVVRRNFTTSDLENAFLVICATNNSGINSRVSEECFERNILVNVVDDPARCNFIVPAVLRQGSLSISISTDGRSPMMARKIRDELEPTFGPEYQQFLDLMGDVRDYVIRTVPEESMRRDIFHQLVYSDIIDLLKAGQHTEVKERINHVLGSGRTQP